MGHQAIKKTISQASKHPFLRSLRSRAEAVAYMFNECNDVSYSDYDLYKYKSHYYFCLSIYICAIH